MVGTHTLAHCRMCCCRTPTVSTAALQNPRSLSGRTARHCLHRRLARTMTVSGWTAGCLRRQGLLLVGQAYLKRRGEHQKSHFLLLTNRFLHFFYFSIKAVTNVTAFQTGTSFLIEFLKQPQFRHQKTLSSASQNFPRPQYRLLRRHVKSTCLCCSGTSS